MAIKFPTDTVGKVPVGGDLIPVADSAAGNVLKEVSVTDLSTAAFGLKTTDNLVEGTNKFTTAADIAKLAGIEAGAEVNNISDLDVADLTDGLDSILHYHVPDRARANHTGTQTAATISDFDTEVSNNTDVAANTAARHSAVTVTDTADVDLTLVGQDIQADLKTTTVTPGSYIHSAITVDSKGRITSAANGSLSGTPLTTKGDLLTYDTGDARLGVGTNGQTLVADSLEPTGLKWSSAGAGDVILDQTSPQTFINGAPIFNQGLKVGTGAGTAGNLKWNAADNTIDLDSGLGPVGQLLKEEWTDIYNGTGITIPNGSVVYADGQFGGHPSVKLATSNTHEKITRSMYVTTMDIPNLTVGVGTTRGYVKGIDTSTYTLGEEVYLSPTVAGGLTSTRPTFQDYVIRIGGTTKTGVADGEIFVDLLGNIQDTFQHAWDGGMRESFDFLVTSDGTTITGTLTNKLPARDLTMIFSDGFTTLDTTTAPLTIALTAGVDTNPQENFIYIPLATKVLTVSTSDFPTTEHIKIAYVGVGSALGTQTYGCAVNQNMNDHIKEDGDNGHLLHMSERIRLMGPVWRAGVEGSSAISGGGTGATVAVTAGQVYQLHKQTFPAINTATTGKIYIVNNFTTPYSVVSDFSTQTLTSTGASLSNTSFSIVVWGVQNKSGTNCHLMANLPSGTYSKTSPIDAVNDVTGYSNYSIPTMFRSTGFLIARFTYVRSSGVRSLYNTQDLRGKVPNSTAGGGGVGGGVTSFTGLTDTPSAYTGQANKLAQVNATELALEFTSTPTITGTNITGVPIVAGTTGTLSVARGGTGVTTSTGTGSTVLSTSPTLITPLLGTPTSGTLTNCSGTAANLTAGLSTATNGLKSATTTVGVSTATAPTTGQVLTATSGTAATWQTPTGGGASFTGINGQTITVAGEVVNGVIGELTAFASGTFAEMQISTLTRTTGTLTITVKKNGTAVGTATITSATTATNGRYYGTSVDLADAFVDTDYITVEASDSGTGSNNLVVNFK